MAVYALSGLLAGVAGYLEAGQLGIISQNDGTGLQFSAILAVLVGGLSVKTGGIGRVEKTLVGTLIAGMIANYFVLQGVAEPYEQAAIGFVILAAVLADHVLRRGADRDRAPIGHCRRTRPPAPDDGPLHRSCNLSGWSSSCFGGCLRVGSTARLCLSSSPRTLRWKFWPWA